MEFLIKQRGGFRSQLTKLKASVDDLWDDRNSEDLDPLELESIELKIETLLKKLTELDIKISDSITDDTKLDEEAEKCVIYVETAWDIQSRIRILIRKFDKSVPVGKGAKVENQTPVKKSATVLPKLFIPKFNGDPLNWQEFWDSYRHSIHENSELSEIEKFQHLKNLLTDDAKTVADGYRLTSANYYQVVEVLIDRFGSEELAVFAHFDKLLALPVSNNDTQKLQTVYDETEKHIRSLVSLGLGEETFGQVFTPIILSKLPRNIRTDLHRRNGSHKWKLSSLRELFREEIKARQMGDWTLEQNSEKKIPKPGFTSHPKQSNFKPKPQPITAGALNNSASKGFPKPKFELVCIFCKGSHRHAECNQVTTLDERKDLIKGVCYRCLRKGHMAKDCVKPPRCFYCSKTTHHSCICPDQFGTSSSKEKGTRGGGSMVFRKSESSALNPTSDLNPSAPTFRSSNADSSTSFSGVANSCDQPGFVQMQMALVKLGPTEIPVRLFFDGGCSRSYITSELAKKLRLKSCGKELISNGRFEETQRRTHSYPRVQLLIPTVTEPVQLSLLVTDTIACPITRIPINPKRYPVLQKVPLADPPPLHPENVTIDILIGNDQYYSIVEHERIELPGGLMLLESKLGYITSGPVENVPFDDRVEPSHLSALFVGSSSVSFQNADLERFWSLEDIGVKDDSFVKDDELALERFNSSIRFDGTRYEVGWPWKSDHPTLPSNYNLALNRLRSLTKRLQKLPELLQVYDKTIRDQVRAGVVEQVPDPKVIPEIVHYLPHHCIIKPDRATTKVRVVYDASAKASSTLLSLNECLLRGPVFLQDLCGLLLRFRLNQYAVTADIEKAFLQVSLKPKDREVTRFLWLKDPNGPVVPSNLEVYRFARVLFGVISSPFLLDATIKHFTRQSPLSMTHVIADGIYVDNLISGASTEEQCLEIYASSKQLFSENGMNIREWASNSELLMRSIPALDHSRCPLKVLGLIWDPNTDYLSFASRSQISPVDVVTKRHLVSAASKVFDPCGFVSPVVLQAKILVQELWVQKIKWDQTLPSEIKDRWNLISDSLHSVSNTCVPRFLGYPENGSWILHTFCDASCKAYTGVVYLQQFPDVQPKLVFSKSKLAPIKKVSMNRLELMGVVLGCRITKFVIEQMALKSATVTVWSDSKCVLQWNQSNKLRSVFVENRVREIQSFDYKLRYVPTSDNPADISSRGCTHEELESSKLWWSGPKFLLLPEVEWPACNLGKVQTTDLTDNETTATAHVQVVVQPFLDLQRFSSLQKVVRVTAWVLRFAFILLGKVKGTNPAIRGPNLSTVELTGAMNRWVRVVQSTTLTPSAENYSKVRNLWKQLDVFVDPEGMYRCKGRIQHAQLPESFKFPLLLPKVHPFTNLVVKDVHTRNMHAGPSHTLSILRQKFWIPQGRSLVKSVLKDCRVCRRFEGGPFAVPAFPPLPSFRLESGHPFRNVGVDYFGPLFVQNDSKLSKVWICLFTCASSRAVHLEVVTDMTTSQFLLALRRFISAYWAPQRIISDNAKHFKLADNFLQRLWSEIINSDVIQDFSANQGIQWVFIPEYAPWMGGFYERLVGVVKRSLKKVLGRQSLSLVQLQTVVSEVSSVVNTRPLVAPTADNTDPVLTPADLLGKAKGFPVQQAKTYEFLAFDPPDQPDKAVRFGPSKVDDLLENWKTSRNVLDQFWQTWSSDYLSSLRSLRSTHKIRNASDIVPAVGTVVTVKSNLPRSVWAIGKITELFKSNDGQFRSAKLKLPNGKLVVRPTKLLYPIESNFLDQLETGQNNDAATNESLSVRPRRKAALAAKQRIQQQLDSEAADTGLTLCCFVSGITMAVVYETISGNSPLARMYSQHSFQIGAQSVTSITMGAWYFSLICHDMPDLAHELVNQASLRKNAHSIVSWLEQVNFRLKANINILLKMDQLYYESARLALEAPNSKVLAEFERLRKKNPDVRIQFVACCKTEYIFSCGTSSKFPTIQDPDTWPGFNVFGEVLTILYSHWAFGDEISVSFPTFDQIKEFPDFFNATYEKAVLILSDSQSRHAQSLEYSDIIRRSGASFAMLVPSINPTQLLAAKYVIILAGTNMSRQSWDENRWEEDWRPLREALYPILFEGSDTQILVNGPVWNTDFRSVKAAKFSEWFTNAVSSFDNVTFFDWSDPHGNPFVKTNNLGQQVPHADYHDSDNFHVSKDGYLLFWRRWCFTFPELQLLSIKLSNEIWQPLNLPHVNHSVNNNIQA